MNYFGGLLVSFFATAWLICSGLVKSHRMQSNNASEPEPNCSDIITPQVRLLGRSGPHEGRVEILHDSEWGAVCDDLFDWHAASVVCRMLGFTGGVVIKYAEFYDESSVPVMLDDVQCTGSEISLMDCGHSGWGQVDFLCSDHAEDVAVQCCGPDSLAWYCTTGDPREHAVRLTSELGPHEGMLSIYHEGTWGTVQGADFGDLEALVVCRSMGYSWGESATGSSYRGHAGRRQEVIWLSHVTCRGTESQLVDCEHSDWLCEGCHHDNDAAVRCR